MKSVPHCVSEYLECYSDTMDQEHYGILRSKPLSSEEVHTQGDVQKTFCLITNLRTHRRWLIKHQWHYKLGKPLRMSNKTEKNNRNNAHDLAQNKKTRIYPKISLKGEEGKPTIQVYHGGSTLEIRDDIRMFKTCLMLNGVVIGGGRGKVNALRYPRNLSSCNLSLSWDNIRLPS